MRRILTITAICTCVLSCGQSPRKTASGTLDQLHQQFVDVMLDSTASWKQVTDLVYPFVDSLCVAVADENNLKNRMFGQQWGYMTIELMSEKYAELNDAGKDADYEDVTKILGRIADGLMLWFYSDDELLPHVWRDHYYVCHQHAEETTNGFFHLNESVEEDEDSRDLVRLENWSPKDSIEDGYPMYAVGDASIVEKMLHNDVAYLMFQSGVSANGDPGETEIARLSLNSFQEKWKEIVH